MLSVPDKLPSGAPSYPTSPNIKDQATYVQLELEASYPQAPLVHLKPGTPQVCAQGTA